MAGRETITTALLGALRAATLPGGTSTVPIGDGEFPAGHPRRPEVCAVLEAITGGRFDGPGYSNPEADPVVVFQVTTYGWRRDQVEAGRDFLRHVVVGPNPSALNPVGWRVIGRMTDGGPGGVERGENEDSFYASERYRIACTSS